MYRSEAGMSSLVELVSTGGATLINSGWTYSSSPAGGFHKLSCACSKCLVPNGNEEVQTFIKAVLSRSVAVGAVFTALLQGL